MRDVAGPQGYDGGVPRTKVRDVVTRSWAGCRDTELRSEALEHVAPALVLDVELVPEPAARHRRDLSEKAEDTVLDRSLALVSFPAGS